MIISRSRVLAIGLTVATWSGQLVDRAAAQSNPLHLRGELAPGPDSIMRRRLTLRCLPSATEAVANSAGANGLRFCSAKDHDTSFVFVLSPGDTVLEFHRQWRGEGESPEPLVDSLTKALSARFGHSKLCERGGGYRRIWRTENHFVALFVSGGEWRPNGSGWFDVSIVAYRDVGIC